uniref:Uncharacterized protein n=1 Tax=Solanum tuberosum TaxID=4113 RepID=M1CS48_SOLTU
MRGSHDQGGGDRDKNKEQQPHLKNHDTYKSDAKKFGRQNDAQKKAHTTKGTVATYAMGRMTMQSALNCRTLVPYYGNGRRKIHKNQCKVYARCNWG